MQIREVFKEFLSLIVYWTKKFIVYISVKGTYLVYSCKQIAEVTSL